MAAPLNVLFITADQWRGECLSALGHPMVKTPNLDALAAEGVLFERHYANCAPCGPSPRLRRGCAPPRARCPACGRYATWMAGHGSGWTGCTRKASRSRTIRPTPTAGESQ